MKRKTGVNVHFFIGSTLNDYMEHIVETKLQINGQKHLPKM